MSMHYNPWTGVGRFLFHGILVLVKLQLASNRNRLQFIECNLRYCPLSG